MGIVLIVIGGYLLYRSGVFDKTETKSNDDAKDLLAARFARGEIDVDEYYHMLEVLNRD